MIDSSIKFRDAAKSCMIESAGHALIERLSCLTDQYNCTTQAHPFAMLQTTLFQANGFRMEVCTCDNW